MDVTRKKEVIKKRFQKLQCQGHAFRGGCCEIQVRQYFRAIGYSEADIEASDANMGLGCGPASIAELKPGILSLIWVQALDLIVSLRTESRKLRKGYRGRYDS